MALKIRDNMQLKKTRHLPLTFKKAIRVPRSRKEGTEITPAAREAVYKWMKKHARL